MNSFSRPESVLAESQGLPVAAAEQVATLADIRQSLADLTRRRGLAEQNVAKHRAAAERIRSAVDDATLEVARQFAASPDAAEVAASKLPKHVKSAALDISFSERLVAEGERVLAGLDADLATLRSRDRELCVELDFARLRETAVLATRIGREFTASLREYQAIRVRLEPEIGGDLGVVPQPLIDRGGEEDLRMIAATAIHLLRHPEMRDAIERALDMKDEVSQ